MSSFDIKPPRRVAVLAGGESAEREISLRSGTAVSAALIAAGYEVVSIDPTEETLDAVDWRAVDAAFIALHGGDGENGTLQAELDRRGVPYTGSGPDSCRLAMSKSASKSRFVERGVPTPRWVAFQASDNIHQIETEVTWPGYPIVVKPDGEGSSLGVHVARSNGELPAAIAEAAQYDHLLLAERMVQGREFTVAVFDEQPLPVLEIISADGVFSYAAKYENPRTEYRFDFVLPSATRDALADAAVGAARALGTSGLVRVDLMLDRAQRPWVLEVNTSPGMTERSLAPRAAARAGWDMRTLVDRMVRVARFANCAA